jgi:hypothetical protein
MEDDPPLLSNRDIRTKTIIPWPFDDFHEKHSILFYDADWHTVYALASAASHRRIHRGRVETATGTHTVEGFMSGPCPQKPPIAAKGGNIWE